VATVLLAIFSRTKDEEKELDGIERA